MANLQTDTVQPSKVAQRLNYETALYLLALLVALGVRMFQLGAAPAFDYEAGWALQALHVARPMPGDPAVTIAPNLLTSFSPAPLLQC